MKCDTCKYWDKDGAAAVYGEERRAMMDLGLCRAEPPIPAFWRMEGVESRDAEYLLREWPETYADDWCGKHMEEKQ
jgi:hypothetical protein